MARAIHQRARTFDPGPPAMLEEISKADIHSWKGVAGLLQERFLAEQQQQQGAPPSLDSPLDQPDDSFQRTSTSREESSGRMTFSGVSSFQSPASSIFNLGTFSLNHSPRKKPGLSAGRTPISVPSTPLRESLIGNPFGQDEEVRRLPARHRQSLLSPVQPTSRDRSRSGNRERSRERNRDASGYGHTAGRQASEQTIRPVRFSLPTQIHSDPSHLNGSSRIISDEFISTSPPSIQPENLGGGLEDGFFGSNKRSKPNPDLGSFLNESIHAVDPEPLLQTNQVDPTVIRKKSWKQRLTGLLKLTVPQQQVLKCSIAYLLASLFTFVPFLAHLLSTSSQKDVHGRIIRKPAYSAHMVATIACYFHPARSAGGMILASKYCMILASLAAFFCGLSILTQAAFDTYIPSTDVWVFELGDMVVLFVWVLLAMGGLAWLKQWVNNPSFNTGCSMAAVTLFTVVVKEGGWNKLAEVLLIVVIGAAISNLTCFTLWPSSATTRLQGSITKTLDSFGTLLELLGATFLLDSPPGDATYGSLSQAVKSHNESFTKLKADLAEAQHERLIDGRMNIAQQHRYTAVVDSLQKLAQHLTGLRSGTELQMELLRANQEGRLALDEEGPADSSFTSFTETGQSRSSHRVKAEKPDDNSLAHAGNLFFEYRENVAETMRDLVNLSSQGLSLVKIAMTDLKSPGKHVTALTENQEDLDFKLRDFRKLSLNSVKKLYAGASDRRIEELFNEPSPLNTDGFPDKSGPIDAIYSIYFFVFTLEEFVRELSTLIGGMVELLDGQTMHRMPAVLTWATPTYWKSRRHAPKRKQTIRNRVAKLIPIDPSDLQPQAVFPEKRKNKSNTLTTPSRESLTRYSRWKQAIWRFQARLQEPDIKYAIKVGLGTVILAFPAFTQRFRPTFLEFRGEWALIAFWATMSPSIGGTNLLSFYRVAGTLLGAVVAVAAYTAFPENPVVLPIIGFLFSIPCFWIITQRPAYQQAGRFILLTYNLTCLYAYNQRERDLSALEIGWRRSASVIAGVVWATVVSNLWWPFAARRELRMGLSDFSLDLAYLYSQLVRTYSGHHTDACANHPILRGVAGADEESPLLEHAQTTSSDQPANELATRQFMSMELHLQIQLINLRNLLSQTKNEPRLKGPFPQEMYAEILNSCQTLLDKLHSMRCVITRQEWDESVHIEILRPINEQRREMVGNVILYLYLLSASFRLRLPMPPVLPAAEISRRRLVDVVRHLDIVKQKIGEGDIRHLLIFAYALAMQGVIRELEFLGRTLQDAFGVISQTAREDFETLFV